MNGHLFQLHVPHVVHASRVVYILAVIELADDVIGEVSVD
jgi:hypothetical protein